jgi:signal transduction histidine kinase
LAAIAGEVVTGREADAANHQVLASVLAGQGQAAVMLGDASLAERLLANLVDNAIRYNVPGGTVTVRAGLTGGQAFLRVSNTGPAVPPGEVARLFAPFQRLAASRAGQPRDSAGLGLSIVSAIAAAHGADLDAIAPPGGGLDIRVRFPPLPAPAPAAPPLAPALAGNGAGAGFTGPD